MSLQHPFFGGIPSLLLVMSLGCLSAICWVLLALRRFGHRHMIQNGQLVLQVFLAVVIGLCSGKGLTRDKGLWFQFFYQGRLWAGGIFLDQALPNAWR